VGNPQDGFLTMWLTTHSKHSGVSITLERYSKTIKSDKLEKLCLCLSYQKPSKNPSFPPHPFEKQNLFNSLFRPSLINDEGEKKPGVPPQKHKKKAEPKPRKGKPNNGNNPHPQGPILSTLKGLPLPKHMQTHSRRPCPLSLQMDQQQTKREQQEQILRAH